MTAVQTGQRLRSQSKRETKSPSLPSGTLSTMRKDLTYYFCILTAWGRERSRRNHAIPGLRLSDSMEAGLPPQPCLHPHS